MLLVYSSIYLKSVLRYKLLILDTYHVKTHGYFLKPERVHEQKELGNSTLHYTTSVLYITPSPTLALFTTFFYVNRGKSDLRRN